jgi:glycosyltransferase involved in cell wall biosynthesis
MRILIVSPVFWPESFRINELAFEFTRLGHEVTVLAGHPNYPAGRVYSGYGWAGPYRETWEGVSILRFPVFPRATGRSWELLLHYASWLLGACLRLLVSSQEWDVVFVFQTTPVTAGLPALLLKRMAGTRTVVWVQDLWPEVMEDVGVSLPNPLQGPVHLLCSWIYRSFDAVLAQNEAMGQQLLEQGVLPERLRLVPNWAEDIFSPTDSATSASGREVGPLTILLAGNLGRAQGLPTLLEAVELLRQEPVRWILLGGGPMLGWLRAEVSARGLTEQVVVPGNRPLAEMPEWYAQADIFLLTLGKGGALSRTVPGRLQSYLAFGKPVLVSADGEAARVVEEAGAGFVVGAGDFNGLASIVQSIIRFEPGERREMGERGRDYCARHFGKEHIFRMIQRDLGRNAPT